MTLTDRISNLLARGRTRQEIIRKLCGEGYVRNSVVSMISREIRHGREGYKKINRERSLALNRKRGVRPPGVAQNEKLADQHAHRDPFIRENYGKMSASTIAEHLGCSRNAVIGRANRMGLKA